METSKETEKNDFCGVIILLSIMEFVVFPSFMIYSYLKNDIWSLWILACCWCFLGSLLMLIRSNENNKKKTVNS